MPMFNHSLNPYHSPSALLARLRENETFPLRRDEVLTGYAEYEQFRSSVVINQTRDDIEKPSG